jgi:hypothetical protein
MPDPHIVTLTSEMPGGEPGVDDDPDNPLARAVEVLLSSGKPFSRYSACFLDLHPFATGHRWFGTFVYSAGDRLVYFPGFTAMQRYTQTSRGRGTIKQHQLQADHLTLESDRHSWHLTSREPSKHLAGGATTAIGNGAVLWFGMSIANPEVMRVVRVATQARAAVHPNDSRRRAEIFMRSRNAALFNIVQLARGTYTESNSFIHFSVFVGPVGCTFETSQQHLALPWGSPYVAPQLPEPLQEIRTREHKISLPPAEILVVTSVLPGRATVPVSFTSPGPS